MATLTNALFSYVVRDAPGALRSQPRRVGSTRLQPAGIGGIFPPRGFAAARRGGARLHAPRAGGGDPPPPPWVRTGGDAVREQRKGEEEGPDVWRDEVGEALSAFQSALLSSDRALLASLPNAVRSDIREAAWHLSGNGGLRRLDNDINACVEEVARAMDTFDQDLLAAALGKLVIALPSDPLQRGALARRLSASARAWKEGLGYARSTQEEEWSAVTMAFEAVALAASKGTAVENQVRDTFRREGVRTILGFEVTAVTAATAAAACLALATAINSGVAYSQAAFQEQFLEYGAPSTPPVDVEQMQNITVYLGYFLTASFSFIGLGLLGLGIQISVDDRGEDAGLL